MELFRGYIPTKDKAPLVKYKKNPSAIMTLEQIKDYPEYAGVLARDIVLVDLDDGEQAEKLMDLVEDLQLNCRVYQTTRGKHFIFRSSEVNRCYTHCKLAVGFTADIKIGNKDGLEILKFNNKERFIEWDNLNNEVDELPDFLKPIKSNIDFNNLGEGDGRNQALFNYILTLQTNGFSKDRARNCIKLINKYLLKEPLSEGELDVILRDEAFNKPIFFDKTTFLFDKFATYLMNNNHIVKINGQLHIYKEGVYVPGNKEIESIMITLIPNLKDTQRKEVLKYLDLIAPSKNVASANYIAFRNGIYDLSTDSLEPYTSDIVITNKIPYDYVKGAYNELTDKTLNKIACFDNEVRAVLEECIGYCFYRRNELGKAFILTGDKSNGKSTFLDVLGKILGEDNTCALDLKELGDRFSSAMMFGKLANIGDDIGDDFLQGTAVSLFKKVVTGNRIKAERKGQDPFDFNPYTKFLFSANEVPRMKDKTGAVIRRLVMIPFNATFSKNDEDYDPFIKYKLIEESSINYLIVLGINGLRRVIENNEFTQSQKVKDELKSYEIENNPLLAFIDSVEPEEEIENQITSQVYTRYDLFCVNNKYNPVSNISFSKQICKKLNLRVVDKKVDGKKMRIFVK